jgi:hypothetical protein
MAASTYLSNWPGGVAPPAFFFVLYFLRGMHPHIYCIVYNIYISIDVDRKMHVPVDVVASASNTSFICTPM